MEPEPARGVAQPGLSRAFLGIFGAVGALNAIGLILGNAALANITKPLLMPLLAAFVLAEGATTMPTIKVLLVGMFFAWLGDLALMSDAPVWFVTGMAMFLIMQICYVVGFYRLGARSGFASRRWVLFVYPAFWVIANAALWAGLGPLRLPIAVYSAALVTMAMTSVALGTKIGIGGTVFMCSDLMIGVTAAYGAFPGARPLIMLTYIAGQGLIATAWLDIARARATTPEQPTALSC